MRVQIVGVSALMLLAACGQEQATTTPSASTAQPATERVLRGLTPARWVVRDGALTGDRFALQQRGQIFAQNARTPVAAGDVYTGSMTITSEGAADVTLRITNGCGTDEQDASSVEYSLHAGSNALKAGHVFSRAAECARLTLATTQPVAFKIDDADLTRETH